MARFFDTEKQLTRSQIEELEIELGFEFPIEYKNHLLKFNGGRCDPSGFSFEENGVLTESTVDWFLAVYEGEYDNLKDYFCIYKLDEKRMPELLFPIAHDAGGNLICMNRIDKKIYFWDHECEVDYNQSDYCDESNLHLVANNLDDFISRLK